MDSRITLAVKKPNPLFEKWILDWIEEAKNEHCPCIKSYLENALSSLRKFPILLTSGRECMILEYFGQKLCLKLDLKLEETGCLPRSSKQHKDVPLSTLCTCDLYSDSSNILVEVLSSSSSSTFIPGEVPSSSSTVIPVEAASMPSTSQEDERLTFLPNRFEIILLVDTAETVGGTRQNDKTISELNKLCVLFEVRQLKVGDFAWIARDEANNELVLPYIVERKRLDDLAKSIKDGRFHEQKYRLKQCGLPNIFYLVEETRARAGLPLQNIRQAISNTMASEKFNLRTVRNHTESMKFISAITALLKNKFRRKTLHSSIKADLLNSTPKGIPGKGESERLLVFQDFSKGIIKNKVFSVKEMFIKQLIQLHGLSSEKAWAIADVYPSIVTLTEAFESKGSGMLVNIPCGLLYRKIGKVISRTLYLFYTVPIFV